MGHRCLCCGYNTLGSRGSYEICPVCFWEDEVFCGAGEAQYLNPFSDQYDETRPEIERLLDERSGANHGLTLRQAKENFRLFGACEEAMLPNVRPPRENER